MKKSVLVFAVSTFIAGVIFTSCDTPKQKVENAQNNVTEANNDLDKANQEYQADIDKCRKETAEKINANEESIKELKAVRAEVRNDKKDDYDKQIAELEQKDNNMKKKLDDYKPEGKEKWKLFKSDFNKGMDDLGNSIKDLTASNKKHN